MKFNFADYKGNCVMRCKTEEEAKEFCRLMHEDGRKWFSGDSYLEIINWGDYKSATCYNFNDGTFGRKDCFIRRHYTILKWVDFKKEPVKEWVTALKYEFATNLPTFTEDTLRGYKSIYIDGVTIAIPMETPVGIARKHPNDEFDAEIGEALAYFRMEGQEESRVWFDEVCSTTEQWKPKQGERYWYISSISEKGVSTFRWENDNVDNSLLSRNLVFKTKEKAIAKTRELGWVE